MKRIVIGILIFAVFVGGCCGANNSSSVRVSPERRVELKSLYNEIGLRGSFLGFSSEDRVYYWEVMEDGGFAKKEIRIEDARFYEDQIDRGYLIITFEDVDCLELNLDHERYCDPIYSFHIPPNSIYTEFNLK